MVLSEQVRQATLHRRRGTERKNTPLAGQICIKGEVVMPSAKQKSKVSRVMREHKKGKLTSGSGKKVKSRKQAIAIAMSESGQSRKKKNGKSGSSRSKTSGSRSKASTSRSKLKRAS
jgi:Zn-dependent metalloprotease